ncbi:MAG: ATP-binding cassette domain-containing protein [Lachnospiraceae bacterium]|nr:ATP-binding cassette domain-containing protein [Lachnospiraceae bacterium]
MNYVEVSGLSLVIGIEPILTDINISFEQGKIHGLIGRNGSGKTMLMKCICGFVRPTAGSIYVKGKELGKDIDFPESLGLIIETPGFIPYYSGLRNLELLAAINKKITEDDIRRSMESVGLDPGMRRHVGKYSLGMRQRLGLAQAIMEDPELLVLDEPFNGLDEDGVKDFRRYLLELKEKGKTIIMSSHNREDIEALCDDWVRMEKGRTAAKKT